MIEFRTHCTISVDRVYRMSLTVLLSCFSFTNSVVNFSSGLMSALDTVVQIIFDIYSNDLYIFILEKLKMVTVLSMLTAEYANNIDYAVQHIMCQQH